MLSPYILVHYDRCCRLEKAVAAEADDGDDDSTQPDSDGSIPCRQRIQSQGNRHASVIASFKTTEVRESFATSRRDVLVDCHPKCGRDWSAWRAHGVWIHR
jgi:hypothetical protein